MDELTSAAARLIRENFGINVKSIGDLVLQYALTDRMKKTGKPLDDYHRFLLEDDREVRELHQLLLISESWFLRETQSVEDVLRNLKRTHEALSILSVPCARGEEPITALYYAMKEGFSADRVRIFGVDVSERSICQAEKYVFHRYSFRGTTEEFRNQLFDQGENDTKILKPELRRCLKYQCEDVLRADWHSPLERYDLIFCRNLLIYLEPSAQESLIEKLTGLLNTGGYLILSSAEAVLATNKCTQVSSFSPGVLQKAGKVRPGARCRSKDPMTRGAPAPKKTASAAAHATPEFSPAKAESFQEQLKNLTALADHERFDEAYSYGMELLESYPSEAEIHFILGIIASRCGHAEQCKFWIDMTLRLDPGHEEARLYTKSFSPSLGDK